MIDKTNTLFRFNSIVFQGDVGKQIFAQFPLNQARDFRQLTKQRMIESKPAGNFTGFKDKSDVASRRRGHRASAPGQRPAIETGNLLNAIAEKQVNDTTSEVYILPLPNRRDQVKANIYGWILQNILNRPIMDGSDVKIAQDKAMRDGNQLVKTIL